MAKYRARLNFSADNIAFEPMVFGTLGAGSQEQVAYPNLIHRDAVLDADHPVVLAARNLGDPLAEQPTFRPAHGHFGAYFEEVSD